MELAGFCLFECAYKSALFSLYPAYSEKLRSSVLIKLPQNMEAASRLKAEHEAAARWDAPGLIRVLDLISEKDGLALVLENFRGLPIKAVIQEKLPLDTFLPLALELCFVVEGLHARGLAHNDLNSETVWVCTGSSELKVTGLDRASAIGTSEAAPKDSGADLSAMGRIFFRLLTGLDWAEESTNPTGTSLRSSYGIPRPLSDICARLLTRNEKKQYGSAYGLRCDMAVCAGQWASSRKLAMFPIGKLDEAGSLRAPSRTLGRERELRKIMAAYEEVENGASRIVFISGNPGAGKTFLASEAGAAISARNGVFVAGKTDLGGANITPLQALLRALGENSGQSASRGEPALPPESGVSAVQAPNAAAASPEENLERFRMQVRSMAERLVSDGRPLALFLDDLQWAGPGTFSRMEELAGEFGLKRMMLIGAYRTGEISDAHPLPAFLEKMKNAGNPCAVINCPPLSRDDSAGLTASYLGAPAASCRGLGDMVYDKTSGYPFQTLQFLRRLFSSGSLRFARRTARWEWDEKTVIAEEKSVDGKVLAARLLDGLPPDEARILSAAAMIGLKAETAIVGEILEQDEDSVVAGLGLAAQAGLVEIENAQAAAKKKSSIVFLHDTIREAALSRLVGPEAGKLRLRAGLALKARLAGNPELIFDCVNILNCADFSGKPEAIEDLAFLNTEAAGKAAGRGEFDTASRYVGKALALLGQDCWARNFPLALEAYRTGALSAYMSASYDEAVRLAEEISARAVSFTDRAWAAILVSKSHFVRGMDKEAPVPIIAALSSFGLNIPKSLASTRVYVETRRIRKLLSGDGLKHAEELPEYDDPDFRSVLSLILHMVPPRRAADPAFCRLAMARAIDLVLQKGLCPEAAAIFALYSFGLRFYEEDTAEAYRVGMMALKLKDRYPPSGESVFVDFYVNLMAKPWGEHMRGCPDGFRSCFDTAMERGNLEFAAQSAFCLVYNEFFAGAPLEELLGEGTKLLERISIFGRRGVDIYVRIILQAVENLMGLSQEPGRLNGAMFSEDVMEARVLASGDVVAMGVLRVFQMICALFFGPSKKALALAHEAQKYMEGTKGTVAEAVAGWYHALCLLQGQGSGGRQAVKVVGQMEGFRSKLAHWAEYAPMNYQHRFDLIEAEIHRIFDRPEEAENCYRLSAERARKGGFVHDAALANEMAAKFFIITGRKDEARLRFLESRGQYLTWGAKEKVRDLNERLGNAFMLLDNHF